MNYFFNHTTRNILVAFMTLFNDIKVKRYDDNGAVSKTLEVPIKFGPLSKYYMSREEDGSLKRYYIQYPTMAVTVNGFNYSTERAVSTRQNRLLKNPDVKDAWINNLMPSPWDVEFTLYIKTESFSDFTQIIEQIIPFFNPSINLRVKEFNTVNLERDIRVTLGGLNPEFTEEVEEESKRYISGQLTFTADAWFYKPISDAKVIETIHSKYGFDSTHNDFDQFSTSGMDTSAVALVTTSGSVTSGTIPNYDDKGYVNVQLEN